MTCLHLVGLTLFINALNDFSHIQKKNQSVKVNSNLALWSISEEKEEKKEINIATEIEPSKTISSQIDLKPKTLTKLVVEKEKQKQVTIIKKLSKSKVKSRQKTKLSSKVQHRTTVSHQTSKLELARRNEILKKIQLQRKKMARMEEAKKVKAYFQNQYQIKLRSLIQSRLVYPAFARRMGQQGTAKVKLVVEPNGSFSDVKIVNASKFEVLNQNAKNLITSLSQSIENKLKIQMSFIVPVEYNLRNSSQY